jgi:protein-S-isoprenylcysteine O-methyltransferase Ste14
MLLLRSVAAAALLPGTVTVVVPWVILRQTESAMRHRPGVVLIALGTAVLVRCIRDFAVSGRGTLAPVDPPRHLVVSGLYRYVRNPMYVGVVLMLAGEAWAFGSLSLAAYAAGFLAVVNVFIQFHEEPALLKKFGASYEQYTRDVPRWVPRTKSRPR